MKRPQTITSKGQITIPIKIIRNLKIDAETLLTISQERGKIIIERIK